MAESQNMAHFPPGSAAPKAADRAARLRDPAHLAKLNEGKAQWYALPLEERQRITAQRQAAKQARRQAREEKRKAKEASKARRGRGDTEPPPTTAEPPPETVRSRREPTPPPPPPSSDDFSVRPRAAAQVRGLIDLCAALGPEFGTGARFIQVTRLKPLTAFGVAVAGVQKHLWEPMDDAEFATFYGGGEYSLRGYAQKENGARALTDPVAYRVPGAPNLDAVISEDDVMRPNGPPAHNGHPFRRPGIVTPQAAAAEAQIHDRTLTHHERLDEKRDERRRREREEREEREERREERELSAARIIAENKEKELDRLEQAHARQLELAQQGAGKGNSELLAVLNALRPDSNASRELAEKHAAEIRQLSESHKGEMLRLTEQHQREIQRLTDTQVLALQRVEDQARLERERADKLVREADQRAHDQIREAERRADQRVTDTQNQARSQYEELRTRSEERIRDQNQQWQQRFDDLKANHDREIRQKDSEIALMRSNLEGNMAVILSGKDNEIKRLQHDLREARDLAEKNKDWLGKITEFEHTAEKLGFSKSGDESPPDEDLKTTALKAGLGALQRLPEMITAGADAVAKMRNPGVPPDVARRQAHGGMVRSSMRTAPRTMVAAQPVFAPLAFATEEGGAFEPPPGLEPPRPFVPPPPGQPSPLPPLEQSPSAPPVPPVAPLPPAHEQPVAAPLPPVPPVPGAAPAAPPEVEMTQPPPSALAVAATAAPAAPVEGIDEVTSAVINQFRPILKMAFESRVAPEQFAKELIQQNGVESIRAALGMVTFEQLVSYLRRNPGDSGSLVTRNGEKFLRETWRATQAAVGE